MKSVPLILLAGIVSVSLLPSCANKFTPAQREALSSVSIVKTEVDPEAYEEPYGGDEEAKKTSCPLR